jgi:hypothetical protein
VNDLKFREPVTSANVGCLNCGAPPVVLSSKAALAVGFGMVDVSRDGVSEWTGNDWDMKAYRWTRRAKKEPDHSWQIEFVGPLHGETYQFQGDKWVMVETNMGFA